MKSKFLCALVTSSALFTTSPSLAQTYSLYPLPMPSAVVEAPLGATWNGPVVEAVPYQELELITYEISPEQDGVVAHFRDPSSSRPQRAIAACLTTFADAAQGALQLETTKESAFLVLSSSNEVICEIADGNE